MAGNAGNWYKTGAGSAKGQVYVSRATLDELGITPDQARTAYARRDREVLGALNSFSDPPKGALTRDPDSIAAQLRSAAAGARALRYGTGGMTNTELDLESLAGGLGSELRRSQERRAPKRVDVPSSVPGATLPRPSTQDRGAMSQLTKLDQADDALFQQARQLDNQRTNVTPVPGYYNRAENRRREKETARLTGEINALNARREAIRPAIDTLRRDTAASGARDRVVGEQIRQRMAQGQQLPGDDVELRGIIRRQQRPARQLTPKQRQLAVAKLAIMPVGLLLRRYNAAMRQYQRALASQDDRRIAALTERVEQIEAAAKKAGYQRRFREARADVMGP